jgi:hypothetical protein
MERKIKKIVFALLLLLIFMAISVTGVYAYIAPVKYVSLDINPSIELAVNTFDIVIDAQAMNKDGEVILQGQDIKNIPIEEAIDILVENAVEKNYIAADGSSVISIVTEAENDEENEALQEQCSKGVSLAMSNKGAIAAMYKDSSDLALRQEAKTLGISPGKYKLIKMLQVIDPAITIDAYKDAKVADIIRKANELLIANEYEGKQSEEIDEINWQLEDINEQPALNDDADEKNEDDKGKQDEGENSTKNVNNIKKNSNESILKHENQSTKIKHTNNGKNKK